MYITCFCHKNIFVVRPQFMSRKNTTCIDILTVISKECPIFTKDDFLHSKQFIFNILDYTSAIMDNHIQRRLNKKGIKRHNMFMSQKIIRSKYLKGRIKFEIGANV